MAARAPLLKKEDGALDWSLPAPALVNRIRGVTPWPGAYAYCGTERWQIWRAAAVNLPGRAGQPGTVLEAGKDAIQVAAGQGVLLIHELQSASGKRLAAKHYLAGHSVPVGTVLTPAPRDEKQERG